MVARRQWRRGPVSVLALTLLALVYVLFRPAGPPTSPHSRTLNVASRIYVANLPRRQDRRHNMTMLARRLDARFTFVDAIDMRGAGVQNIMNHVKLFRQEHPSNKSFEWPVTGEWIAAVDWTGPLPAGAQVDEAAGLTCNKNDWTLLPVEDVTVGWEWMTTGRVACWETHTRILRDIAGGRGSREWAAGDVAPIRPQDVAIVLEDDVDMEMDVRKRLMGLWPSLPTSWDMVFLGAPVMTWLHSCAFA